MPLMSDRMLFSRLGACLALCLLIAGCGAEPSQGDGGPSGSLSLDLQLGGGASIEEVWYRISGGEMPEMTGFIDTSASGATASVEVFGIPAGPGYLVVKLNVFWMIFV